MIVEMNAEQNEKSKRLPIRREKLLSFCLFYKYVIEVTTSINLFKEDERRTIGVYVQLRDPLRIFTSAIGVPQRGSVILNERRTC
jgi:hypothetical protein